MFKSRLPLCKAKMNTTRFDVSLLNGKGDFKSWQKKMRVLLSHHKVVVALEADLKKWPTEKKVGKDEIDEETYNLIFFHLSDSVIRKVDGMTSSLLLWGKLESLFFIVAAPNLVFLKALLFNYNIQFKIHL